MLCIQTLASGSRGNSTYIASETTKILVDIGLTLPTMTKRLAMAQINGADINGVLVTHEHSDHIGGVAKFCLKFGVKVFIHEKAMKCVASKLQGVPIGLVETFDGPFMIGDVEVDFFSVPHDSCFCLGYTFTCGGAKFSLATDLGFMRDEMFDKMMGSQIVLLESNHDLTKLSLNGRYPSWLKRRIASRTGHLSNDSAGVAAAKLFSMGTKRVILGHLSEENNSPTLARRIVEDFCKNIDNINIDVAMQNEISPLYRIDL